ncbi:putative dolichyl-phosphate beta-glucosyltransferase-like [Penaeus vannamei]|uniref:Putative dolichyl-phosphate beta-glucosyltransferase-like n=1 Tax=Penaeus vannamei TaxID=6689 RepID=A0A3R7PAE6_PENVA|nr:putative dolichyl-phosphate beta-glucosyltransferase-like [Penaeus vannamei]
MGVFRSRGEMLLFADADGATTFSDLDKVEASLKNICADEKTLMRGVRDTQCGFKLLTRRSARILFNSLHVERWAFDVEMLYLAQVLGIPIAEVAVEWQEIEGTKMTPVLSWIEMGLDLVIIWLRYTLGAWRIRVIWPSAITLLVKVY